MINRGKVGKYLCTVCKKHMKGTLQTFTDGVVLVNKKNCITGAEKEDKLYCLQCISKFMKEVS